MKKSPFKLGRRSGALLIAAALAGTAGCAATQKTDEAQNAQMETLKTRLEESERLNGRLTVRLEEMEDAIFLLEDRVEANRIALQRRGYMRGVPHKRRAQAPQPAPQSSYYGAGGSDYEYQQDRRQPRRAVRRIPLGEQASDRDFRQQRPQQQQQRQRPRQRTTAEQVPTSQHGTRGADEAEVVITEKEFQAFVGDQAESKRQNRRAPTKTTGKRGAQPDVTEEKLSTTSELEEEKGKDAPPKKRKKSALGIYKDALAGYRSGDYAGALEGFETFLASNPRADYVDNALYWIGECHYGLGHYQKAVGYFQRVLEEQPDGNKVPDSMLKMSLAYEQLGQTEDASQALRQLTETYPATNAGRLGAQKLREME